MFWNLWKWFIWRVLGLHVHEEWTQWETYEQITYRGPTAEERCANIDGVRIVRHWQFRRCTMCGKIKYRQIPFTTKKIQDSIPQEKGQR